MAFPFDAFQGDGQPDYFGRPNRHARSTNRPAPSQTNPLQGSSYQYDAFRGTTRPTDTASAFRNSDSTVPGLYSATQLAPSSTASFRAPPPRRRDAAIVRTPTSNREDRSASPPRFHTPHENSSSLPGSAVTDRPRPVPERLPSISSLQLPRPLIHHPTASRRGFLPPPPPPHASRTERDGRSASPPRLQTPHTSSAHTGRSSSISGPRATNYDTRSDAQLLPPLSSLELPRPPPPQPISYSAHAVPVSVDYYHNSQAPPTRSRNLTDRLPLDAPRGAQSGHRGPTVPASERPTVTPPPVREGILNTQRRGPHPAQAARPVQVAAPPPVAAPPLPVAVPPRSAPPAATAAKKVSGSSGGKPRSSWLGLARLDRNLCVYADGVWYCPEPNCKRPYVHFCRLEDHHRKAHGDGKPYRCTFDPSCTAGFATKDELAAHIQSHPLDDWFVCGCGYPYMRGKSLRYHREHSTDPRCKES